jgi:hypothetical protein
MYGGVLGQDLDDERTDVLAPGESMPGSVSQSGDEVAYADPA